MRPKHVPERTCIGCGRSRPKRELVRLVRGPDGRVSVDETGKAHGRGAYIGPARECLRRALERGAVERAFKAPLDPSDRAGLEAAMYKRRATCPYREEDAMSSGG